MPGSGPGSQLPASGTDHKKRVESYLKRVDHLGKPIISDPACGAKAMNEFLSRNPPKPCCAIGDLEEMVRDASGMCKGSVLLIQQGDKIAMECKKRTDIALKDLVNEMGKAKKRLENEVVVTRKKHMETQAMIQDTRSQMQSLDEPMALCSMHPAWKSRTSSKETEKGADSVQGRLQEQKWHLIQTTKELRRHRKLEKDILTDLGDHMDRLKEDIQDKTDAMAIDMQLLSQAKMMSGRIMC
jgi:hypothetical protein